MKKSRTRIGSILLSLALILSLLPVTALAGEPIRIEYLDENGDEEICDSATVVDADTSEWASELDSEAWYVVNTNVTISTRITVSGDVHLILADGGKLTANQGIAVTSGNSLTIYGQSTEAGELIATAQKYGKHAGIGGASGNAAHGDITINGGKIQAKGGADAAGIGSGSGSGGADKENGTITINGGTVTATGNNNGAGIGGGHANNIPGGDIVINGGTVIANGGTKAAGIGTGFSNYSLNGRSITISGGTVTATGGIDYDHISGGAGIGGGSGCAGTSVTEITINGDAHVTATGGDQAAGIGSGYASGMSTSIYIGGEAVVEATGSDGDFAGAGIGTGGGTGSTIGSITIDGGTVTATGGTADEDGYSGAGIGGGGYSNPAPEFVGGEIIFGGPVTGQLIISAGTVTATGGSEGAAGIGNGESGKSDDFSTGADGEAVIHASSISDTETEDWNGIIFQDGKGTVYGDVTLEEDLEIQSDETLEVPEGSQLTVAEGATLTNNGQITNEGEILVYGTLGGNQEVEGPNEPVTNPVASYTDSEGETAYAETLQAAITNADDGTTVELLKDVTDQPLIELTGGKDITIDLNSYDLGFAENSYFKVNEAKLHVTGTGKVYEQRPYDAPIKIWGSPTDVADYSVVTVDKGVTLEGWAGIFITINEDSQDKSHAFGVKVTVNGTIDSVIDKDGYGGHGVYINGQNNDTSGNVPVIVLGADSEITSKGDGIYAAGFAEWYLAGDITAPDALSLKSGIFDITGGTYHSTGEFSDPAMANSNGSENTGAALSLTSNDGYAKKLDVTVTGGTFISDNGYAVYEGIAEKENVPAAENSYAVLSISNGTFQGNTEKGAVSINTAANKKVITGGTFSSDPSAYVADGYRAVQRGQQWIVDKLDNLAVAEVGGVKYTTLAEAIDNADSGDTVKLLKDVTLEGGYTDSTAGLEIRKSITIDGQNQYTISTGTFLNGIRIYGGDTEADAIVVTFRDVTVTSDVSVGRCVDTRGGYLELVLDHAKMITTGSGNTQVLTIGGNHAELTTVKIQNQSEVTASASGYGVIIWNPVNMTIDNSSVSGYAALYFKGKSNSAGSAGSRVAIQNGSKISSEGIEGNTNEFGTIVFEDNTVTISVQDATLSVQTDATDTNHALFCFKTTSGNQVFISGNTICEESGSCATFYSGDVPNNSITITGGTFSSDPSDYVADGYQAYESGEQWIVGKAVQSVTVEPASVTLKLDKPTTTLSVTVLPEDAHQNTVTWSSSDEDVATVDQNGNVNAVAPGTATITATAGDKFDTCSVTVTYADVTSITLDQTEVTLAAGGTTELKTIVLPDSADQTVTWTSSDPDIADVKNGTVTGLSEGTAIITAAAADGQTATCEVTVTAEGDVIVNVAEPDVTVKISGLTSDQETAVETTAKSVNADAAIAAAAKEVSDGLDVDALTAQAREDLDAGVDDPIYLFTQAYLEITATGAEIDENGKIASITLDIKPMVRVLASTAGSIKDLDENNSVEVQKPQELTISGDANIRLTLPDDLTGATSLYIKHEKDAAHTYYYKGTVSGGELAFLNPHGFSAFTFPADSEVVATIDDRGYTSLQAAVDAASNRDTITLNQTSNEKITVQRSVTFTLDKNGKDFTGTISAGAGYEITEAKQDDGTVVYTVTRISTGGSGSSDVSGDYIISVNKTAGGKVTVNPGRADKGDEVTITAIPDDGYVLQSLTVTDKDGDTVRVSSEGRDKYTFTMPGSTVTVKAVFAPEGSAVVTPEISFTDVAENFWAYNEIQWAAENGYMTGTTATTFNPTGTVTRQQVWMILARMAGANPADMAAAKAWAVNNGISDGTNPGGAVTRQQLVALLYRFAGQYGYDVSAKADLSGYPDVASLASYAADAMAWSVANGIIGGTTAGTLNPAGTANRAQFAAILWRFYQTTAV